MMPKATKEYCLSTKTFRVLDVVFNLTKDGKKVAHKEIQEAFYAIYRDYVESPTLSSILTRLSDKGIFRRFYGRRKPRNTSYLFNHETYKTAIEAYKSWVWKEYARELEW
jgi:hypothetical protein